MEIVLAACAFYPAEPAQNSGFAGSQRGLLQDWLSDPLVDGQSAGKSPDIATFTENILTKSNYILVAKPLHVGVFAASYTR